jgi:O-antigen ligase
VNETLQVLGAIAATGLAAAGILIPSRPRRGAALAGALLLAAALIAGQAWDGPVADLRDRPGLLALLALLGVAATVGLALAFRRWPWVLPLAALAALPIRIPVDLGGESSNLLVPLYVVILAGVLASLIDSGRPAARGSLPLPRPLGLALAAAIVLYALQSAYSDDIEFAAQIVGFFLVPFAALFVLLLEADWRPGLLVACLGVLTGEALLFAAAGIVQHEVGDIFWNPALDVSNDFHFYFRINSLFWDPNIYGRYLALAIVLLLAALIWTSDRRRAGWLALATGLIWVGLLLAFSQSSFITLLVGIAVLCALSWSLRWTLVAAPLLVAAIVTTLVLLVDAGERGEAASITSGRSSLVEGGIELFGQRPLQGHGAASFSVAFERQEEEDGTRIPPGKATNSHNEPITVAAEQGVAGILVYLWLLAAALWTLFGGMRRLAPGLGAPPEPGRDDPEARVVAAARVALAAGFCALVVHTIGYAGYLTDPLTWTLIAIGSALAVGVPAPPGGAGTPAPTRRPDRPGTLEPTG